MEMLLFSRAQALADVAKYGSANLGDRAFGKTHQFRDVGERDALKIMVLENRALGIR